ncbi:MAG: hypothetical protein QNJ53_25115 [Pleurocapsa sp. MO_192.B19]|nr:hypothetical protein [Pleurocapsa sp. MO_192.B19]
MLLFDGGQISTSSISGGNAGNVTINAGLVELKKGSFIDAFPFSSSGIGKGGSINIDSEKLIVSDASQISVASRGGGNSGNIIINASDSIELSGFAGFFRGGLVASAVGSGDGGTINLTTGKLSISNGATIVAGNTPSFPENSIFATGTGQPGNINIEANSINLNTEGRIEAVTQSEIGEGANINLQVAEDITLRGDSFISARAINQGDGGNLSIDTRFIIAFPDGNNDILASSQQGLGGDITISAESLFGIQERTPSDSTNDINASSEVSGLDGTVNINTPDINPIQGATELPSNIVEPEQTTAQACQANREIAAKNGLTITGKGGIPAEPGLPLDSLNVSINGETNPTSAIPQPIATSIGKIQPARGIKVTESGEIILTAYRTNNSGERIPEIKPNCS